MNKGGLAAVILAAGKGGTRNEISSAKGLTSDLW